MSCAFPFVVKRVGWQEAGVQLRAVRTAVFVEEQKVPAQLEWDARDENCLHVLAESSTGEPIGAGRLLPDGHLGRMAVLSSKRLKLE